MTNLGLAFILSLSACLFIPAYCQSANENILQSILANHINAMGGVASLISLRNLELRLKFSEPEFEVEGLYRANLDDTELDLARPSRS